jgi:hypothetical protein
VDSYLIMPITINGTGTVAGITAGGLPDGCVTTADIADDSVTPDKLSQPLTLATAQATTSGTSIDFTGIPSWVKRITVMFNGVSTNGTTDLLVQIGAGSVTTSGYVSTSATVSINNVTAGTNTTSGFNITSASATNVHHGQMVLTTLGSNAWASSHLVRISTNNTQNGAGGVTLGGTLDRIRLTTVNGTDTFDAGSVNIMYEG